MTALKMDVASLDRRLPAGETALRDKTASMMALVDDTVGSVRRIATELRPPVLDDLGVTAAIEWQAEQFRTRMGLGCELRGGLEGVQLDRDRSTALFRIFQETLTNVARHARASKVSVDLRKDDGDLVLEVSDDGRGVTAGEIADARSLGLLGMRERASSFGGEVRISGAPGKGTTVTARIPLGAVRP